MTRQIAAHQPGANQAGEGNGAVALSVYAERLLRAVPDQRR